MAFEIEQKIWIEWTTLDEPELAGLIQRVLAARRVADFEKALTILNRVVFEWSGYAEGRNQRVAVYFEQGEFEKSLEDIAETLAREPRHFGSLSGRGLIRLHQGKSALAIQNFKAAMQFHPYLKERHMIPALSDATKEQ